MGRHMGQIELVPFTEAHITDTYLGWLNDKDLMRYSRNRLRDHTRATAREYLESMKCNPFYAILRDGEHVGNIAAYIDGENNIADLTILVGKPRFGIGREAWKLAIAMVFEETEVRKIEAGTNGFNDAMIRIFTSSGMTSEGRRIKHFNMSAPIGDADLVMYGILRADYEQARHNLRGLP